MCTLSTRTQGVHGLYIYGPTIEPECLYQQSNLQRSTDEETNHRHALQTNKRLIDKAYSLVPKEIFLMCICETHLQWPNQPYYALNLFWVTATITNYDLRTTDPANLKSLTLVCSEIWAKMYPDHPYCNFTVNTMKHCHVRCLVWYWSSLLHVLVIITKILLLLN